MATGIRGVHRGFDFATEEHGVTIQRIQTNLSEKRQSKRDLREKGGKEGKKRLRVFSRAKKSKRQNQNQEEPQS